MRTLFIVLVVFIGNFSFSQSNVYTPLPKEEITSLFTNISGVEITFYESSTSVSMEGTQNCGFLPAAIDTLAPDSLNTQKHAYIMIMVDGDFYMDAELSWVQSNPYLIFNKDGVKYYSKLTEQGISIFNQLIK